MAFLRRMIDRVAGSRPAPGLQIASTADVAAEWKSRGNEALGKGQFAEAERCFREAVVADPSDATARLNLGFAMLEQGDAGFAADCLTQAIALRRQGEDFVHEAHYLLARAHRLLGDTRTALASLEAAVAAKPGFAEPMEEAVSLLHEMGRHGDAQEWARRLVAVRPTSESRILHAQELHLSGRNEEALVMLQQVSAQEPANVKAIRGRGLVLLKLGRVDEARLAFEDVLALAGPTPDALTNLAIALQKTGRLQEALRALDDALRSHPSHRGAICSKVAVLTESLRLKEAIDLAREALRVHPDDADLHWNLAFASLLAGDYEQGWAEHEWRLRSNASMHKVATANLGRPRWSGEDLRGRTLLLVAEQGFGDSIQFVRYVPIIAKRAARVLLDVPQPLESLVAGLAPNCRLVREGEAPNFDFHCALMSLPHLLGTTLANVPADVPYLKADPAKVQEWRQRIDDGSRRLKVGLAWSGSPTLSNDHNRSMPLSVLQQLAAVDCQFISLQTQVRERDESAQRSWRGLRPGDDVGDFASTAALIEALDLVITVDTSIGHLAGALGRPVWILLSHFADWRWMLEREDSPWYPTVRLFRQPAAGDWDSVLQRVADELSALRPGMASSSSAATQQLPAAEWKARGNAALGNWNLDEAARCYREAVAADSTDATARLNLGFVLIEQGSAAAAIESLVQALALRRPSDDFAHEAHFLLGRAYQQQGQVDMALPSFEKAVALRPDFAEPMEEAAKLLLEQGRYEEMLAWATRLQSTRPGADAGLVVAQALNLLKRPAEALGVLEGATAASPDNASAWTGLGEVLLSLGRAADAVAAFERALAITGPAPRALTNHAIALSRLGRHQDALQRLDQALALDPNDREALFRRGDVLIELLRVPEAIEFSSGALRTYPNDPDLLWNRAMGHLLLGQYAAGWADYEHRWYAAAFGRRGPPQQFGRPRWTGRESLEGRTIWLQREQGLGDAIHFVRYVPLVAKRAGKVLLQVPAALANLARTLAPNCELVEEGQPLPAFDYVCPLMSLPLALGTTLENIPSTVPYLHADPVRVQAWRDRLKDKRGSLLVGLAWSGNAAYSGDHARSIPLATFRQLAVPGCRFVQLQPDLRPSDKESFEQWGDVLNFGDEIRDFAEAAALTSAMDLVITVETSFAQLAAALARPVWVLLAHRPDWRWMLEREDSPWYPTARLYRQRSPGDWPSVLSRLRGDLAKLATTPAST